MVWAPGVLLALVSHGSLASLVFGLPTIRRGGEGSPQYDSHKVARASGDARRRARPRTPAVPLHAVGAAPELRTRRAVSKMEKQLHVHPVVDLLVVLRLLPRRYSGNIVAPVGVAGRRVVVARPLRGLIDETHLMLVLICQ